MVRDETWFNCDDGTKLFLRHWQADTAPGAGLPPAALHIVHGMAEHGLRYERLAEKLTACGIEVWAADQRGHGKTADPGVNAPSRGGRLGHCSDKGGFDRISADVHAINLEIAKKYPDVPLFLMGHSWGSFICQNYIEKYAKTAGISGCILSGTRGPGGIKEKAGVHVMRFMALTRGQRNGSKFSRSLADGPYNKPFKPNRTPFDWISRDEQEVDKYVNDPLCGQLCSSGFYRDLAAGLLQIHSSEALAKIPHDLPVYIFSGSADPVGEMGHSPTALVDVYRSLGITDLEFTLYPGARHETLNETNREEVMDNLASWLSRHMGTKNPDISPKA